MFFRNFTINNLFLRLIVAFCLELVSNFKFPNEKYIAFLKRSLTADFHKSLAIKLKYNKLAGNNSISVKRVKSIVHVCSVVRPNKIASLYLLKFVLHYASLH